MLISRSTRISIILGTRPLAQTRTLVTHQRHLWRGFQTTSASSMASSSTTSSSPSSLLTPTYDNALQLLALLQSNKTIINLFAAAPAGAAGDINASALPEMRAWLARAGYEPSDLSRLKCVHVAGTKGKGSVSTLVASVLRRHHQKHHADGESSSSGFSVGTYTSPHLVSPRERICLDGEPIPRDRFTTYFFELWGKLSDAARREGDELPSDDALGADGPSTKPFYFRFLTLLAFHVFLREGVRSAVIECGIGGEYDSTNVLLPEAVTVSVVTQLGIDHVNMLGDTVEKIAWHKAGIFKKDVPAYTYQAGRNPPDDSVIKVLRDRAEEKGTTLSVISDSDVATWEGVSNANLEGAHQKGNMALAMLAARQHLLSQGQSLATDRAFKNNSALLPASLASAPEEPFLAGLREARLRGRCEVIAQDHIQWYLDGAHTEDSMTQVARWFATKVAGEDSIRVLIFNQQDRDGGPLLRALLETLQAEAPSPNRKVFHHAFCPTNDLQAASAGKKPDMSVQRRNCDVVRQFCPFTAAIPAESVSFALDMARTVMLGSKKSKDNFKVQVLVTGSFNLVGPALRLLEPDAEL